MVVLITLALAAPAPALARTDVSYSSTSGMLITASTRASLDLLVRNDEGVLEWQVNQNGRAGIEVNLVAGLGCRQFGPVDVLCLPLGSRAVTVTLSDDFFLSNDIEFSDDLALGEVVLPDVPTLTASMTVEGRGGRDDLQGSRGPDTLRGGEGPDLLEANLGNDVVEGGGGNDTLFATNFRTIILSESIGPNGADTYRGGSGTDVLVYRGRREPVAVTLDGQANDGAPGEADNADADLDVENVLGGGDDDTIVGNDGPNDVEGGGGDDELRGSGGDDELRGSAGDDLLVGGAGADRLIGDFGFDRLIGGPGDDELLLRDGERDACPDPGTGTDTIDADLLDQACVEALVRQQATIAGRARRNLPRQALEVTFGAIDEGPNVVLTTRRLRAAGGGVRVGLACPRRSGGCAGTLRLSDLRARTPLGKAPYRLAAGRRGVVELSLSSDARRRAAALRTARLTAREQGTHGPKTTVAFLPLTAASR
jgi:hypothetical protein